MAFFLLLISLNGFSQDFSRVVDEITAKSVGLNFFHNFVNTDRAKSITDLKLLKKITANSFNLSKLNIEDTSSYIYIFETLPTNGFIIISADNAIDPIIGYSDLNKFSFEKMPTNITGLFQNYVTQIQYVKENKIVANEKIKSMWNDLKVVTIVDSVRIKSFSIDKIISNSLPANVAPLIKTKWDQSPLYNLNCPPFKDTYTNPLDSNTVTGCVATATAQVMNFWSYPSRGFGFKQYTDSVGNFTGNVSANFGSINYQWSSMANSLTRSTPISSIKAVSTLIGNVGIAAGMNYNYNSSGTQILEKVGGKNSAEYALKNYFNYNNTLHGLFKSDYNDLQWIDTLRNELSLGRPIIYAGFGKGSGHCFVLDGYSSYILTNSATSYKFSINWGWSGYCDGNYTLDNLIPTNGSLGIGAGNGEYTDGQQAIIGIQPPSNNITYSIALNGKLTSTAANVNYGGSITLNVNLKNTGTTTFVGDYAALVFDSTLNFVDSLSVLKNYSLSSGNTYVSSLVFSNSSVLSMLPGKYILAIYYRPIGQGWQLVSSDGINSNYLELKVINKNQIELYSSLNITPSLPLVKDNTANVQLNLYNSGTSSYIGQYDLNLYSLDGKFAQKIGSTIPIDSANALKPNYAYTSPFLNFSSIITVGAGDYYMAVTHTPKNGNFQLVGSTSFANPIKVTVKNPALVADKYEKNDSLNYSTNLPVVFQNDSTKLSTTGSNIHIGQDVDYYKIVLGDGFKYSINLNVYDVNFNPDGNAYSLNSIFYYSTNGKTWSSGYKNKLPSNLNITGADTLYIFVGPNFIGYSGNYQLNININRTCLPPPTPVISPSGNISICQGSSSILNSSSTSGNQWYLNGTAISGAVSSSETVKVAGTYTVISTVSGCSSSPSNSVNLLVNVIPSTPTIYRDSLNNLVSSSVNKNIWYKDGVQLTDSTQKYKPTAIGSYTVKAFQNGCYSLSSNPYYYLVTDVVNISSTEFIKLLPNPFLSNVNVDFVIHGAPSLNLNIHSLSTGSRVFSMKNVNPGSQLQLASLTPGIYLFIFSSLDGKFNFQFKMVKL